MKTIQYTDEQAKAILARENSISLAAGAGCGKTFVLTERFLAELAPAPDRDPERRLSELVAITFTDPAARELRTRIRHLVRKQLATSSPSEQGYWQHLYRALDACRVSTIHSLCGQLLRSHAFDIGLDPLFAILDQPSALVLRAEAIEDTLRQELAARNPETFDLASAWQVEGLKKRIAGLIDEYRSKAFVHWLEQEPGDAVAAWELFHRQQVWPTVCQELARGATPLVELLGDYAPADANAAATKAELLDLLTRLSDGNLTPSELATIRQLAQVQGTFAKGQWEDVKLYESFRDAAKSFRDAIDKLPKVDFTSTTAQRSAELGIRLAHLTRRAAEAYNRAKDSLGALDYDDLLTHAHHLLTDESHRDLQEQIRGQIKLLMVDEFQDTDHLQVEIVKALSGDVAKEGKLFFVGDEKQSIYRFRGAEPQVFVDLRSEVTEEWQLPLSKNFRSQPAILHFVNALFENVFENAYQPLLPDRQQVTPEPAIEFLWTPLEGNRRAAGWKARSRQAEARSIAARLRELFDGEETIVADKSAPGGCRPVEPGDVAILFRVLSDVQYYEEALRAQGIDYYLVGGHAFYSQQEVYDILHLLRVIASSCDELSLAGLLRSPFFSLADETIFWLASRGRGLEAGLFSERPPSELEATERKKVIAAAQTLKHLRKRKQELSVPQLLAEAFERTGYDAALLAEFMGERKLANVEKLVEQARAAEASGVGSLDDFVVQLTEYTTSAPKEALATTSPETASVVRLMTVHQAKGLEFPVVVVPDIDRESPSPSSSVEFHRELGPLVQEPDAGNKDASGLRLFRYWAKSAEAAETNRLFYVACTRAADYLLLSTGVNELENPTGPWLKTLADSFDLMSGELIGEATSSLPKVRANIVEPTAAPTFSSAKRPNLLKLIEQAKREPADPVAESLAAPLGVDPSWRRRFSVTRLSGQIIPAGGDWWQGESVSVNGNLDPLPFGTYVHAVLERIDLSNPNTVTPWCETLAPQHHPHACSEAASAARSLIKRFLTSPRAQAMRTGQELHREVEFLLAWPPGRTADDSRYVQGYLDCLYQDSDGRWKIVDYKTNHCTAAKVETLAAKYELQMLVYALAVEQTWCEGPSELVLHFLRPGAEHVIPWNEKARERAMELVESKLADATL